MASGRIHAVAMLATLLLVGCGDRPRELVWQIFFEPASLGDRALVVEAQIISGGCTGGRPIYRSVFSIAEGEGSMQPPVLGPGSYGFRALIRDTDCLVIAEGCDDVVLPRQTAEPLVVIVRGAAGAPACVPSECTAGRCTGDDADAGTPDVGMPCPPGFADCNNDATDGCEADLSAASTCGGCEIACAAPAPLCASGMCSDRCSPGESPCLAGCVDLTTDPNNCGVCDARCPAIGSCTSGACTCPPPYAFDGSECRDISADPRNCGAIDSRCENDEFCNGGLCVCRPGLVTVGAGSRCVDLSSDPDNCGSAGNACLSAEVCLAGACATDCGVLENCRRSCVDLITNPLHCGECNEDGECNGDEICESGRCHEYQPATGCSACPCVLACTGDFATCCDVLGAASLICVEGGCP